MSKATDVAGDMTRVAAVFQLGLGRVLQRLALRTGRGPLGPLWWLAHRAVIWAVARWVTAGSNGCEVYLKGGFGFGRPVYGLSDIDAIVVTESRARVEARWRRLTLRFPTLAELFQLWVYERDHVSMLDRDSYLTFGLGERGTGHPAFFGDRRPHDPMAVLHRPGLYGPRRDWSRLGSRKRPPPPVRDRCAREIFAWLELRFIWAHAFMLSADRTSASAAYTCQKLVADPARIWLWLEFGEQAHAREEVLARALQRMPDEEETLRFALELGRQLSRRPEPPLAEVLPFLARTSSMIARRLAASAAEAATTQVKLVWGGPDELLLDEDGVQRARALGLEGRRSLLPLADWRARALPGLIDLALAVTPGDPSDLDRVAALAHAGGEDFFPALRDDQLLVLPSTEVWHRGKLRGVECQTTDPVSIALVEGIAAAAFPDLPGWSAEDCARRALAEHHSWLTIGTERRAHELPYWMTAPYHPELVELGGLFTAARAALFADSLRSGAPELQLTAAAIVRRMADYGSAARTAAEAGYEALSACRPRRGSPDAAAARGLRDAVSALAPYAATAAAGVAIS